MGTHKYFPLNGVEITRVARDGQPHAPVKITLPSDSLQSKARGRDHIFVYSTSPKPNLTVFEKPGELPNACVEIYDPVKFLARLRSVVRLLPKAKASTLIHDQVRYYSLRIRLAMFTRCLA